MEPPSPPARTVTRGVGGSVATAGALLVLAAGAWLALPWPPATGEDCDAPPPVLGGWGGGAGAALGPQANPRRVVSRTATMGHHVGLAIAAPRTALSRRDV